MPRSPRMRSHSSPRGGPASSSRAGLRPGGWGPHGVRPQLQTERDPWSEGGGFEGQARARRPEGRADGQEARAPWPPVLQAALQPSPLPLNAAVDKPVARACSWAPPMECNLQMYAMVNGARPSVCGLGLNLSPWRSCNFFSDVAIPARRGLRPREAAPARARGA